MAPVIENSDQSSPSCIEQQDVPTSEESCGQKGGACTTGWVVLVLIAQCKKGTLLTRLGSAAVWESLCSGLILAWHLSIERESGISDPLVTLCGFAYHRRLAGVDESFER